MKKAKKILLSLALIIGVCAVAVPTIANAAVCPGGYISEVCNDSHTVQAVLKTVINTMLFLLGAVSVIVIIIAGFRMAASGGNADSMAKSRNSILYAAIGVVIAASAYAIVNFVILRTKS